MNAANSSLLGGGGVDGAIHRAGGPEILEACRQIRNAQGKCKVGQAVITSAGKLPSKFVIHTVGPFWHENPKKSDKLLASCYVESLTLAIENGVKSIAFPNISTGIYKFPKDRAAHIAIEAVKKHGEGMDEVTFVCFDDEKYRLYKEKLA